jgi:NAD(P)-dependent dehydrogenase (short-subunit alcohol dehydrogenase family)
MNTAQEATMKHFARKVVVITGGATGIGLAFAKRFGREGAKIVIAGRRQNRIDEAVAALQALGVDAAGTTADVTSLNDVEALADFAWERHGQVDAIVNNAGVGQDFAGVLDLPLEVARSVIDINLFGTLLGCQVFGRRFVDQGTPAAIYNVGSENSLFNGFPLAASYVASKHAVLALSESLAEEVPDFIDVSLICPGFVSTELGPPGSMDTAMDVDRYVDIAWPQIVAGEFLVVSHAYNMERINARHAQIEKAYATYAPRYEGDVEFDVRTFFAALSELGQADTAH